MDLPIGLGTKGFTTDLAFEGLGLEMNELMVTFEISLPSEGGSVRAKGTNEDLGYLGLPVWGSCLGDTSACSPPQRSAAVARVTDSNVSAEVLGICQGGGALGALERVTALSVFAGVRARSMA